MELFSIRIRRTFQLVSTVYNLTKLTIAKNRYIQREDIGYILGCFTDLV